MLAKLHSATVIGMSIEPVEVEVDIYKKTPTPSFAIVGLGDRAVDEARERVRSAIKNSNIQFPYGKITINLAPADLRKSGPAFDLPIAVGILIANKDINISKHDLSKSLFLGELALDGGLRHVNGILAIMMSAKKINIDRVFIPECNSVEASLISGIEIIPAKNLSDLILYFDDKKELKIDDAISLDSLRGEIKYDIDMKYIKGQEHVKRSLEIAAAGDHNVIMSGPPGSGKTLLARAFRTILPDMTIDESLETTKIYSVSGDLAKDQPIILERPFRSPHHTSSAVSLVGGGRFPRPGEISMAHRGVLFLDEFAEFPSQVLDVLRQPLEDHVVTISRAGGTVTYPAKFTLIAAMNPCPCGFYSDPEKECTCGAGQIASYKKKISGPLLDRIDLHIDVPRVDFEKLSNLDLSESSSDIKKRVQECRDIQTVRFEGTGLKSNSEMTSKQIDAYCLLDDEKKELMRQAVQNLNLSARGYHRTLKIARTIADLEQSEQIETHHIAEALQYRSKDSD